MDKKDVVNKIVEVVTPFFEEKGYKLKSNNKFEKKNKNSIYLYEIDVAKSVKGYSLHLKLLLLNKDLSDGVNQIMKQVLSDKEIIYPANWTLKDIDDSIKIRSNIKDVYMLTDWRLLKEPQQSLKDFNDNFSIWFCSFNHIEDINNWNVQLIESVELAIKWFKLVDDNEYLIDNTDFIGLYLLKKANNQEKLKYKYDSILSRMKAQKQNTKELELFNRLLIS